MSGNKFGVSIVLASLLYSQSSAQVMDIGTNYYRDYLDLAQNKGRFAPSDSPVTFTQRNGQTFTFQKIPDRGARNNKGNFTSLGRNFVVTAKHTLTAAEATNFSENRGWFGNTKYEYLPFDPNDNNDQPENYNKPQTAKNYGGDTTYMRTSKYIVEGNIDPLDVPNLNVSGQKEKDQANADAIQKYFRQIKNSGNGVDCNNPENKDHENCNITAYQAGTGAHGLEKPKPKEESLNGYDDVVTATEFEKQTETDKTLFNKTLGGSLNDISINYSARYLKNVARKERPGVYLYMSSNGKFRNRLLPGDSGSGFFIYDKIKEKWVLVGVLTSVGDTSNDVSIVTKTDFDDYKKDYEHKVSNANISGNNLKKNKDNIFSANSKVTLNSDLDLGHGGIVVQSGKLTLEKGNSHSNHKITKFAGFDIAENASLDLKVSATTSIHKVGKGKLIVNSTGNKTLRLGEGEVQLMQANAFEDLYLASGRGTLKLFADGDNLNDKLYFGNGGGALDLNGKSQRFDNVAANSNQARILNSSATKSTLTVKGTTGKDTIFHAHVGGDSHNNLDLTHNGAGHSSKSLIFDGGFNISGKLTVGANAKLVLQGHPTTHALGDKSVQTEAIKKKIKDAGVEPPDYVDLSRPSTLAQPDWDKRKFKASEGVDLGSNSELTIGKEAVLEGSLNAKSGTKINIAGELKGGIEADGAKITIGGVASKGTDGKQTITSGKVGGNINLKSSTLTLGAKIKHYIDKFDGANTSNESDSNDKLKYQQEVESGELDFYTVQFAHKISMDGASTLQMGGEMSSASLKDLVIGGSSASNYTPVKGSGKLTIENLEVSAEQSATFEPDTTVTKKFMIKSYKPENNPVLKFTKALTLDKDMDFNIGFLGSLEKDKKYELLSAPHITNYGAKFDKTQTSNGLYKNYTIENGKLYMTLK
ncbi:MAG: S6 family peptidase, partial [Helicobacteraceae bacterium]